MTEMFRKVQGAIDAELGYALRAAVVERAARAVIEAMRTPRSMALPKTQVELEVLMITVAEEARADLVRQMTDRARSSPLVQIYREFVQEFAAEQGIQITETD